MVSEPPDEVANFRGEKHRQAPPILLLLRALNSLFFHIHHPWLAFTASPVRQPECRVNVDVGRPADESVPDLFSEPMRKVLREHHVSKIRVGAAA